MNNIGVLELQGNYDLHHKIFSDLGIRSKGIKTGKDIVIAAILGAEEY